MWGGILEWVLPFLLIFLLYAWLFRGMTRQMGGGGSGSGGGGMNPFNVGKATGKLADKDKVNVTFKDVAGMYGAKEEVMEIVDFLKNPGKYTALGGKIPQGRALLVGLREPVRPCSPRQWPARPTCPSSASAAPTSWRCSWEWAPAACATSSPRPRRRPLHSLHRRDRRRGRARGKNVGFSSNDERENTLNQLLTEMDGFGSNSGRHSAGRDQPRRHTRQGADARRTLRPSDTRDPSRP